MGSIELRALSGAESLVASVHEANEPIIVFDGEDECLVAMSPSVFERVLYDSDLLNASKRETLHL